MTDMPTTLDGLFWKKVTKGGGCWEWQGRKLSKDGYGLFRFDGERHLTHRLAYQLSVGEIPPGKFVLHSCDNPKCVRPGHLRVGTHEENMADRKNGKRPLRIKVASTKLSVDEFAEVDRTAKKHKRKFAAEMRERVLAGAK